MGRHADMILDIPHDYPEYGSRGMSGGDLMDGLGILFFLGVPALGAWLVTNTKNTLAVKVDSSGVPDFAALDILRFFLGNHSIQLGVVACNRHTYLLHRANATSITTGR